MAFTSVLRGTPVPPGPEALWHAATGESEELRQLRKENAELKRVNEILKTAFASFARRNATRPATVVKLAEQLRGRFGVEFVLRILGIASSTYHGWVARQIDPSRRERDDRAILSEIAGIHAVSGGTYGNPRAHQVLRRRGIRISCKRVERLMRQGGSQGAFLRKQWQTPSTRRDPRTAPAPHTRRVE
ncbi:IS3 family transposase [Actinosynnema sp. NPDC050801]|uniref:IS3 family transposase n=1 Tax=unclassified Actinosynnema TaxID=2637065 RepID=UPI0034090637